MLPQLIQELKQILQNQTLQPIRFWFRKPRIAVVSLCLRFNGTQLEVFMIQRSKREGDPWSGHMAFPGGHQELEDSSHLDTAFRETYEEVGIDLKSASYLGSLNPLRGQARGIKLRLVIHPLVFFLEQEHPPVLNEEVAKTVWIPLKTLYSGSCDSVYPYKKGKITINLPCFHYESDIIWGLSYRMLKSFLPLLNQLTTNP